MKNTNLFLPETVADYLKLTVAKLQRMGLDNFVEDSKSIIIELTDSQCEEFREWFYLKLYRGDVMQKDFDCVDDGVYVINLKAK